MDKNTKHDTSMLGCLTLTFSFGEKYEKKKDVLVLCCPLARANCASIGRLLLSCTGFTFWSHNATLPAHGVSLLTTRPFCDKSRKSLMLTFGLLRQFEDAVCEHSSLSQSIHSCQIGTPLSDNWIICDTKGKVLKNILFVLFCLLV